MVAKRKPDVTQAVDLNVLPLTDALPNRRKVVAKNRCRTSSDRARWTLRVIVLVPGVRISAHRGRRFRLIVDGISA